MKRFNAANEDYADRDFVEQSYRWFDSIWETISTERFLF